MKPGRRALTPRLPKLVLPKLAMPRFGPSLLAALLLASIIGNVALYSRYSSHRPLVTVGSYVVRRGEYQSVVDDMAGKAALNKIVYAHLIQQAAAQAHVEPTSAEIDARLKDWQQRSPATLAALAPETQRAEIETQLALENLRVKNIPVSDADVQAFYKAHKAAFAAPTPLAGPFVVSSTAPDARRAEKLMTQGLSPGTLAADPAFHVVGQNGFSLDLTAAPPALQSAVGHLLTSLPPGQAATLRVGSFFWTMMPASRRQSEQASLDDARARITRLLQLQKAPSAQDELQTLYIAHRPTFDMDRYAADFSDMPGPKVARRP